MCSRLYPSALSSERFGRLAMTSAEIAALVELIVATWPAGTRGHVWTNTLRDRDAHSTLDDQRMRTAYRQLRDTVDRAPTPGQLLNAYDATSPMRYGWPQPEDTGTPISLADYLARHDDDTLRRVRDRHPTARAQP